MTKLSDKGIIRLADLMTILALVFDRPDEAERAKSGHPWWINFRSSQPGQRAVLNVEFASRLQPGAESVKLSPDLAGKRVLLLHPMTKSTVEIEKFLSLVETLLKAVSSWPGAFGWARQALGEVLEPHRGRRMRRKAKGGLTLEAGFFSPPNDDTLWWGLMVKGRRL